MTLEIQVLAKNVVGYKPVNKISNPHLLIYEVYYIFTNLEIKKLSSNHYLD